MGASGSTAADNTNIADIVEKRLQEKSKKGEPWTEVEVALRDCYPADCAQRPAGEPRWRCMFAIPQDQVLSQDHLSWIEAKYDQICNACAKGAGAANASEVDVLTKAQANLKEAYEGLKAKAQAGPLHMAPELPSDPLTDRVRAAMRTKPDGPTMLALQDCHPADCVNFARGTPERWRCTFGIPLNKKLGPIDVPEIIAKHKQLILVCAPHQLQRHGKIDPALWKDLAAEATEARNGLVALILADTKDPKQVANIKLWQQMAQMP